VLENILDGLKEYGAFITMMGILSIFYILVYLFIKKTQVSFVGKINTASMREFPLPLIFHD